MNKKLKALGLTFSFVLAILLFRFLVHKNEKIALIIGLILISIILFFFIYIVFLELID